MKSPLHILHLEDDALAAELISGTLAREGIQAEMHRVETKQDFERAIQAGNVDLILADFQLPTFDGISAQKVAQEKAPNIPFIFISGTIGEDRAVEVLKNGAIDYVLKDRLAKLGPAVRRAMKEVADRAERDRMEQALRDSERRFRLLAEHAIDLIFRITPNGIFNYASPACQTLLGYQAMELLGTDLYKIIHPDDVAQVRTVHRQIVENRSQRSGTVSHRMRHKKGEYVWFETSSRAASDFDGRMEIHGISRDVTERKNLERQLLQSQKIEAVGQLAGGIAHDFNNLLTVIMGRTELMLFQLAPDDKLRSKLELVHTTAQRAADLTRQLLAFSRRQVLEPHVIELNKIVKSMNEMLRRLIGEHIVLATELDDKLRRVKADPSQIEQVIVNLVVNARDAMPRGGNLIIETANAEIDDEYSRNHVGVTPGAYVMLAVTDTGTGMSADVKSHIFEPFFTTKEVGKGTGLGLSTVYGIVKQSGGHIYAYSEPGHGTIIKVYLPVTVETPHKASPGSNLQKALETETILVVEDESGVRQLVEEVLAEFGYKILAAPDGTRAIELCKQHPGRVHLMLTDVVMPGVSGAELATELKKLKPGMKVLYMSGYTDNSLGEHGVLKEGIEFIQKPFTQAALVKKIREVLNKD